MHVLQYCLLSHTHSHAHRQAAPYTHTLLHKPTLCAHCMLSCTHLHMSTPSLYAFSLTRIAWHIHTCTKAYSPSCAHPCTHTYTVHTLHTFTYTHTHTSTLYLIVLSGSLSLLLSLFLSSPAVSLYTMPLPKSPLSQSSIRV